MRSSSRKGAASALAFFLWMAADSSERRLAVSGTAGKHGNRRGAKGTGVSEAAASLSDFCDCHSAPFFLHSCKLWGSLHFGKQQKCQPRLHFLPPGTFEGHPVGRFQPKHSGSPSLVLECMPLRAAGILTLFTLVFGTRSPLPPLPSLPLTIVDVWRHFHSNCRETGKRGSSSRRA